MSATELGTRLGDWICRSTGRAQVGRSGSDLWVARECLLGVGGWNKAMGVGGSLEGKIL